MLSFSLAFTLTWTCQVKEKLNEAEYKEFVGLMKSLKMKQMKILPVLESIATLFSAPGRFPLLER